MDGQKTINQFIRGLGKWLAIFRLARTLSGKRRMKGHIIKILFEIINFIIGAMQSYRLGGLKLVIAFTLTRPTLFKEIMNSG